MKFDLPLCVQFIYEFAEEGNCGLPLLIELGHLRFDFG